MLTPDSFFARCARCLFLLLVPALAHAAQHSNTNLVTIRDWDTASPFPSVIKVAGATNAISKVTVTLSQLLHGFVSDVDVLLIGPQGQRCILVSDAGEEGFAFGVTLTFDGGASRSLPQTGDFTSGVFRPTNYGTSADDFAAPAPPGSSGFSLGIFNGTNPNGLWSLYVMDDDFLDGGFLAGWSLSIDSAGLANLPPSITAQPKHKSVVHGAPARFEVTAVGGGTLKYQWFLNGSLIPGATNRTHEIAPTLKGHLGAYHVIVTTAFGAEQSASAELAFEAGEFVQSDLPMAAGTVMDVLETNGIIYLGGAFPGTGNPARNGASSYDPFGFENPNFPLIKGAVIATATDNAGGWYIGGIFTQVGDIAVTNLAHIRADNSVDADFRPNPDNAVSFLHTTADRLYVAGAFTRIAGAARGAGAAFALPSRELLPWNPRLVHMGGAALAALIPTETVVYIGGLFTEAGGAPRTNLAVVDLNVGNSLPWRSTTDGPVHAMALAQNQLFFSGLFTNVSGLYRRNVAAADATTGQVADWDARAEGQVYGLATHCNVLFATGSFTNIGGAPRKYMAALDVFSALASDWDAQADDIVYAVIQSREALYVAGAFANIGGEPRKFLAALDPASAAATPWKPLAESAGGQLAVAGGSVLVGNFLQANGTLSAGLAAIDSSTGKSAAWNARCDEEVNALALHGNTLFIGGSFKLVAGQSRLGLAALDVRTGGLRPWTLPVTSSSNAPVEVRALRVVGQTLYIGGMFERVGGSPRFNIAAVDIPTGSVTSWNPGANDTVLAFLDHAGELFVAGRFTLLDGYARQSLASFNLATGQLTPWAPDPDGPIVRLCAAANTLYIGGNFSSVQGGARSCLAAFDLESHQLTDWAPVPKGFVNAIGVSGGAVFASGFALPIQDKPEPFLTAFDRTTASVLPWNPNPNLPLTQIKPWENGLLIGGLFTTVNGAYRIGFANLPWKNAPLLTTVPVSQVVEQGSRAIMSAAVTGQAPLSYQWLKNSIPIPGATLTTLEILAASRDDAAAYTLVVSNALGRIASPAAQLTVIEPLIIQSQPASQFAAAGADITLRVDMGDNPVARYQWQRNGVNISGAVDSTFTIQNAQPAQSGLYSVVIANIGYITNSALAVVQVQAPAIFPADHFASAGELSGASGLGRSSTVTATFEAGEPRHAGKPGGKSVWFNWRAPTTGIAWFSTAGSGFDTLLAVYTGSTLNALTRVAADDDRGGYLNSEVLFNAIAGVDYKIAVDGFGGSFGDLVLSWSLDTQVTPLARLLTLPLGQTVQAGEDATFTVAVTSVTPVQYQWFFDCEAILLATNSTLTITNVNSADVGSYTVEIRNASSHVIQTPPAYLEIGPSKDSLSQDKLQDAIAIAARLSEGLRALAYEPRFMPVTAGTLGTQVLGNYGSTRELFEPNHGGLIGGASRWFILRPQSDGPLRVDTIGSDIDTLLAVYVGTDLLNLQLIASDNNGAPDRRRSLVRFAARRNIDYLVAVDGVNGAQGTIYLNWSLEGTAAPRLELSQSADGALLIAVQTHAGKRYILQSRNLANEGPWQNVATHDANGALHTFSVEQSSRFRTRFFRVAIE